MKIVVLFSFALLWLGTGRPVAHDAALPVRSPDDDLARARERSMVAAIKEWHNSTDAGHLSPRVPQALVPTHNLYGINGPSLYDIRQSSGSSTCALLAAMGAYVRLQPQFIQDMFIPRRTSSYTVRLKEDPRSHNEPCMVLRLQDVEGEDEKLPLIPDSGALWPRMIVHTLRKRAGFDCSSGNRVDAVMTMFSGEEQVEITGLDHRPTLFSVLLAGSTSPGIVATKSDLEAGDGDFLQRSHAYTILRLIGADAQGPTRALLYNPDGRQEAVPLTELVGKLDKACVVGYSGANPGVAARSHKSVHKPRQDSGKGCTWSPTPPEAADAVSYAIEWALARELSAAQIIKGAEAVVSIITGAAAIAAATVVLDAAKSAKDSGAKPYDISRTAVHVASDIATGSSVNGGAQTTPNSASNGVSTDSPSNQGSTGSAAAVSTASPSNDATGTSQQPSASDESSQQPVQSSDAQPSAPNKVTPQPTSSPQPTSGNGEANSDKDGNPPPPVGVPASSDSTSAAQTSSSAHASTSEAASEGQPKSTNPSTTSQTFSASEQSSTSNATPATEAPTNQPSTTNSPTASQTANVSAANVHPQSDTPSSSNAPATSMTGGTESGAEMASSANSSSEGAPTTTLSLSIGFGPVPSRTESPGGAKPTTTEQLSIGFGPVSSTTEGASSTTEGASSTTESASKGEPRESSPSDAPSTAPTDTPTEYSMSDNVSTTIPPTVGQPARGPKIKE